MNVLFKIVQDLIRKVTCSRCGHTQKITDREGRRKATCQRCGKQLDQEKKHT